jgi:hypothetical protein
MWKKYNTKIAEYGFKIISDNYETNNTVLTIKYPDGTEKRLSWMQFYWERLPRYLKNNDIV